MASVPHIPLTAAAASTDTSNSSTRATSPIRSEEANNQSITAASISDSLDGSGHVSVDTSKLALLVNEQLAKESNTTEVQQTNTGQSELSSALLSLFEEVSARLRSLRDLERSLSANAGQSLRALQQEESAVNALTNILKSIKTTRKKLLARIASPRWEVKHHYQMTAFEHNLGHRQAHVLDVAEMLPGHLRIYAAARVGALIKRSLSSGLAKAKLERNEASETIKEIYRQLRDARADIKEVMKMLDAIKARGKHLLSIESNLTTNEDRNKLNTILGRNRSSLTRPPSLSSPQHHSPTPNSFPMNSGGMGNSSSRMMMMGGGSTSNNSQSLRLRYFASLNLAPKASNVDSEARRQLLAADAQARASTYNADWKTMVALLHSLENQSSENKKAEHELKLVQSIRKKIGLQSLPQPDLNYTNNSNSPALNSTQPYNPNESSATNSPNIEAQTELINSQMEQFDLETLSPDSNTNNSHSPLHSQPHSSHSSNFQSSYLINTGHGLSTNPDPDSPLDNNDSPSPTLQSLKNSNSNSNVNVNNYNNNNANNSSNNNNVPNPSLSHSSPSPPLSSSSPPRSPSSPRSTGPGTPPSPSASSPRTSAAQRTRIRF